MSPSVKRVLFFIFNFKKNNSPDCRNRISKTSRHTILFSFLYLSSYSENLFQHRMAIVLASGHMTLSFLTMAILNGEKLIQSEAIYCQPAGSQNPWLRDSPFSCKTLKSRTETSGKVGSRTSMGQAQKCVHVKILNEQTLKAFQIWVGFREDDETDVIKKHGWKTLW